LQAFALVMNPRLGLRHIHVSPIKISMFIELQNQKKGLKMGLNSHTHESCLSKKFFKI
jgi:hypothetical protein